MEERGSHKVIIRSAVSPSSGLPLPHDQSNACTEYAASAAWLRTVKTTSTSSSSQFLHPTGFAWGKIKTKRPGQEEGREAWGQAAYSVQAFDWTGGKGRPKERDTVRLVNALGGGGQGIIWGFGTGAGAAKKEGEGEWFCTLAQGMFSQRKEGEKAEEEEED